MTACRYVAATLVEHAAVNRRVVGSSPTGGAKRKDTAFAVSFLFLCIENPRLSRGFRKSFSDPYERKTPFGKMKVRPENCTRIPVSAGDKM